MAEEKEEEKQARGGEIDGMKTLKEHQMSHTDHRNLLKQNAFSSSSLSTGH